MYIKKQLINPVSFFCYLSILSLPLTSLPFLPSVYRPITIYISFFPGIFILLYKLRTNSFNISKDDFFLLLYFVLSIIQSFLIYLFVLKSDLYWIFKSYLSLLLGITSYECFKFFIIKFGYEKTVSVLCGVCKVVVIFGVFEILSMKGVLPHSVKEGIGYLLSGKVASRVQLTTMEASWASKLLIFLFPYFYFRYLERKISKTWIVLFSIVFLLTFSLVGFFIFFIFLLILFFKDFLAGKSFFRNLMIVSIFVICVGLLFYSFKDSGGYYFRRVQGVLSSKSFVDMLAIDQSVFIRIAYPVVGLFVFLQNIFGVGIGNFPYYFEISLSRLGIKVSGMPEVMGDIYTLTADPRNLYIRILSESGIFVGGLFIAFFLYHIFLCFKLMKYSNENQKILFFMNLVFPFLSILQNSSLAYTFFWFPMAFNIASYFQLKNKFNRSCGGF